MTRRLSCVFLLAAACSAGEVDTTETSGYLPGDGLPPFAAGTFAPLGTYQNITGDAFMVRHFGNATELYIAVDGLIAGTAYTAHLHVAPCAAGAGGHYKIDPSVTTTVEANELWLRGTALGDPTTGGALLAGSQYTHRVRAEANSIVVHDPANGAKMACADLLGQ